MNLKEWLQKNMLSQREVADAMGISRSLMCDIVKGKRRPTPEMAKKIEQYTKGMVNRLEMLYPGEEFPYLAKSTRGGTILTHDARRKILSKVESIDNISEEELDMVDQINNALMGEDASQGEKRESARKLYLLYKSRYDSVTLNHMEKIARIMGTTVRSLYRWCDDLIEEGNAQKGKGADVTAE